MSYVYLLCFEVLLESTVYVTLLTWDLTRAIPILDCIPLKTNSNVLTTMQCEFANLAITHTYLLQFFLPLKQTTLYVSIRWLFATMAVKHQMLRIVAYSQCFVAFSMTTRIVGGVKGRHRLFSSSLAQPDRRGEQGTSIQCKAKCGG